MKKMDKVKHEPELRYYEMKRWEDVTDFFSEERRYYRNTYLEKCEVYDGAVEVSIFSAENQPYEIYVSYGKMYGIIYSDSKNAYVQFEKIKEVLENAYKENEEPSDKFIKKFAKEYHLKLPNDIFFDDSSLFELF